MIWDPHILSISWLSTVIEMTFLTATRRAPPYSLHSLATRRAHLTHKVYSTLRSSPTILTLKAEHPSRLWERRTPLVPQDVSRLIRRLGPDALSIRVESSPKRIFSDQAYRAVSIPACMWLMSSHSADQCIVLYALLYLTRRTTFRERIHPGWCSDCPSRYGRRRCRPYLGYKGNSD